LYVVTNYGTVMLGWNFRAFSFLILPPYSWVLADSTLFYDTLFKGVNLWAYGSFVDVSWDNWLLPFWL